MSILHTLLMTSVYIFNAQGQYLCMGTNGTPTLSATPVALNVTQVDEQADAGRLHLDNANTLKWILKPSATHTYTIGYQVPDANATTFVYTRGNTLSTTFEEPATTFTAGQWAVSTEAERQPITLDEQEPYVLPTFYKQHADVTFHRTLVQGEWNTLCLPFNVDASHIAALWGAGTQVATFTGDTGTKLLFTVCNNIEAGVPYVLLPAIVSTDHTYLFEGIDISTWHRAATLRPTTVGLTRFQPFFSPTTVPAKAYVFGNGDKMYRLSTAKGAKGYRAYFFDDDPASARNLTWGVDGDNPDTPTAITTPQSATTAQGPIYTPSGQLVRRNASSATPLAPGVYIVNGVKFIVK